MSSRPEPSTKPLFIAFACVAAFFFLMMFVVAPIATKPAEDRKALCESRKGMIMKTYNDKYVCVKGLTRIDLEKP
jgi:hypothetical protein